MSENHVDDSHPFDVFHPIVSQLNDIAEKNGLECYLIVGFPGTDDLGDYYSGRGEAITRLEIPGVGRTFKRPAESTPDRIQEVRFFNPKDSA